jgi:phage/plasmid-like protein (TIGR03299 family)
MSLFGGRRIIVVARLDEDMRIGDDEYYPYMLAGTAHDGSRAVVVTPTTVRVICNNTCTMAIGDDWSKARFRIRHSNQMHVRLAEARQALQITTEASRRMKKWLEASLKFRMNDNQIQVVQTELFGDLTEEESSAYRLKQLDTFGTILGEEQGAYGKTAYAMFNAITGFADHAMRYNGAKGNPLLASERKMAGVIDGRSFGFKEKGINVLSELGVK